MTTSVFGFIWKYLSQVKVLFFTTLVLTLAGEVLWRSSMYFGSQIADLIAGDSAKDAVLSQAISYIGMIAGCLVFHRAAFDVQGLLEARFMPVYLSKVSKDLFNYAHQHSAAFFAEEMAGNVSNKIKTIADNSYQIYYVLRWNFLYPAFAIIVTFFFIFRINAALALIMLALNLLYIVSIYVASKSISPYSRRRAGKVSFAQGIMVDSISNAGTVKSFSNYLFEKKNFYKYMKQAALAERAEIKKYTVLFFFQGISRIVLQATFYTLPVWYWYKGLIGVGEFVLIQTIVYSLSDLYLQFTFGFLQFFKLYGGIKDGLELLSKPHDIVDVAGAEDLVVKKAEIKFEDITYQYKGSKPLFKDFDLSIKAGEKIGLVGHSGSGKSTLIKILSRYYDLQKGRILIDGQDIAKVTQNSLRKNISLIPQDPSLFNRTIMENIRYGNLRATDEQVYEAAKKAYIHDFILSMPNGYESKVGDRGIMLSGGERQRIAIARAILKNAPILVLDEATSALDSASEKYIQESMQELMKGKTVIAIAHRLSTLKEMDRLIVMDKGKIAETGTHGALVRKKGHYQKFYAMQSEGFLKS